MVKCNVCGMENEPNVRYCQGCGTRMKLRGDFFRTLHFDSLAGAGAKGSSLAPLFTSDVLGEEPSDPPRPGARVKPLADRSWFCPDCGFHNGPDSLFCRGCGRDA